MSEYSELLLQSIQTRRMMDEELWSRFRVLNRIFMKVFPTFSKKAFKHLNDLIYYTGGYPSKDSPARVDALAESIVFAVRLLRFVDDTRLDKALAEAGITVSDSSPLVDESFDQDATGWKKDFGAIVSGTIEALVALLVEAQEIQGDLCRLSDGIKITAVETAKEE